MRVDVSGWATRLTDDMVARHTASGAWRNETIAAHAAQRAAYEANATAFAEGDRTINFSGLFAQASSLLAALCGLGLVPGDVVSFQLPNWIEAAVINLAACLGGFICNPIGVIFREAEVGYILRNARSKVLFIPSTFRGFDHAAMACALKRNHADLSSIAIMTVRGAAYECAEYEQLLSLGRLGSITARAHDPNSIKLLLYTSGTTNRPKGVLHSHNTLMSELYAARDYWRLSAGDVVLMPSPITHITGYLYAIEMALLTGGCAVLMERWDARRAIELIREHKVSLSVGATPFLSELTASLTAIPMNVPSMRLFICGGAPVSPDLVRRASRAMPECTVSRAFGSSEAPTITLGVRDKAEQERGATTDGRIVNNDVRVISTVTGAVVRDGEEGEIIARGPELMLGYTDPLLTAEAFDEEGFFHTGDLGCSDGEFLTVTGRKKDLIVRGGENISPQEIEDALGVHPAICEVAVVAMPHERMGEGVCAYIVARQPVSVAQLGEFLGQRGLARQKWPERVELVDALPRTASGKIQKNILRDRARLALKSGPPPL